MMGIRGSRTPEVVRIAKATGHSAIMVDLEHSTMTLDIAAQLCAAACDLGLFPFVRVPEREYGAIGRLLDGGAQGIIAPRVETVTEADTIRRACRFAPRGQRSQLAMVPHFDMRPTPATVLNPALDAAAVVQILLETPTGVAAVEEIAALDGVDMVALGANDFTAEIGVPGRYDDPRVRAAVTAMGEACQQTGKLLMLGGISDLALLETLIPLGVCPLQITGMDSDLLFSGAQARAARFTEWDAARQSGAVHR